MRTTDVRGDLGHRVGLSAGVAWLRHFAACSRGHARRDDEVATSGLAGEDLFCVHALVHPVSAVYAVAIDPWSRPTW